MNFWLRLTRRHHQGDQRLEYVADQDLPIRPHRTDMRRRSFHEHMVHQCVSEDIWFRTMLDIDVGAPPLPKDETRLEFMRQYGKMPRKRLAVLRTKRRDDGKKRRRSSMCVDYAPG